MQESNGSVRRGRPLCLPERGQPLGVAPAKMAQNKIKATKVKRSGWLPQTFLEKNIGNRLSGSAAAPVEPCFEHLEIGVIIKGDHFNAVAAFLNVNPVAALYVKPLLTVQG